MVAIGETLWRVVGLIGMILLSASRGHADDDDEILIPKTGYPEADFYQGAGTRVMLLATANPTEISQNEFLTFTLTISNLVNAPAVEKPSLKSLPAFSAFQIEEGAELDPPHDPKVKDKRVFIYRLRASSEQVKLIPEIVFHYFDPLRKVPESRPQDRFPKSFSNSVAIRVTPAAEAPAAPVVALNIPNYAENFARGEDVLAPPETAPPGWIWFFALIVPPLLAVAWIVVWKQIYPAEAKLVQLKRNRAVRKALAALSRAKQQLATEAAPAVADAVLNYLRERLELPIGAFTTPEITLHLRDRGTRPECVTLAEALFRTCDTMRYAPDHRSAHSIVDDAERLIFALEEPA